MNNFSLGLRNLARNRRRSAVTVSAIAIGYAAILLFAGYTLNVYEGLRLQAIHGELLGHLTVTKRGAQTAGKLNPGKYLFHGDEYLRAEAAIKALPHVARIAPRLAVSGLLSNGRASTIFIAEGLAPADMAALRGPGRADYPGALDPAKATGVTLAQGLADILKLKPGSDASMLVSTLDGQANALDVDVIDTFSTGNAGTQDKFAFMPLGLARNLADADGAADRITVLLDDVNATAAVAAAVQEKLAGAGFDVEVHTWEELSSFYRQVRGLFDMIFAFIFAIVLVVVAMSVANAMSMSVVERTREIGTLRAIGLRRRGVVRLFAAESLLLVAAGCLGGVVVALLVRAAVNGASITYVPPNATDAVPLTIGLAGTTSLLTAFLMCALGILATLLPARRAAHQPIIDSLGHV